MLNKEVLDLILIVGGSYQGKTEYARKNFPNAKYFNNLHTFIKKRMESGKEQDEILEEIRDSISEDEWVVI